MELDSKCPTGPIETRWERHRFNLKLVNPANKRKYTVIVVGTGLAGGATAATLGELGYNVECFCFQDSPRRAHSIAAQGGINAAKNYHNDGDSVYRLFYDTVKGGDFRARESNVYRLAAISLNIIDQCVAQGVPFAREYSGYLDNRSFGGAQVSRTFYARGQTGQQLLLGAYQSLERQIGAGMVKMHPRSEMLDLIVIDGRARGISPAANRTRAGMTLIEVMIASALMMVIVAGVLSAHFLGLRESQLLESKAGVNDTARRAVNQLLQDIRAAKGYDIGTMSGTNFTLITNGILQGAGLKLYSVVISTNQAVDPNKYLIYYFDSNQLASANGMLWRMNSTNGVPAVTVSNLINTLYFTSEDYFGRTQTVRTYKGVIHATLDFCQFQYPLVAVGSNGIYDTYGINGRATPHLPDGP